MKQGKQQRQWENKVQAERIRQGIERKRKLREIALARQALQDRFEACPGGQRRTHFWHVVLQQQELVEKCMFCKNTRPIVRPAGLFEAAGTEGWAKVMEDWAATIRRRATAAVTVSPQAKGAKG